VFVSILKIEVDNKKKKKKFPVSSLDIIGNKKFHAKPQSRKAFSGSILGVFASLREPKNYFQ